ncbi:Ku protein [Specibacter sp. NPDC057265]|uniref:non-homologous end joining protein Ku n=1 Tax=Specibacter sp. NPDC057265 TaxID=3346075 RepID=UPI003626D4A5
MRSIWTGSIAFGLVNVPVKAYGATADHDVSLHQVHDADGGRIRYQRRCEVCNKKVDFEHIDKAYDDGDRTVVLSDEDMHSLPAEKSREIEVVQFVPNDQIDPIMLERSYYLEPDSKSPKAYALLVKTLKNTELTAVVKFALRQKTRLGALRIKDNMLVLQGILWGDEVRDPQEVKVPSKTAVSAQELKMSSALVDQFKGDFNPNDYSDEYQEELQTLIDEKLKHGDSLDTAATFGDKEAAAEDAGGGNVIDLMEALKRSVDQKRGRQGTKEDAKAESKKSTTGTSAEKKKGASKKSSKGAAKKKSAGGKAAKQKTAAAASHSTTHVKKGA